MSGSVKDNSDTSVNGVEVIGMKKRKLPCQIACERCRKQKQALLTVMARPVCGACAKRNHKKCLYEREVDHGRSRQHAMKRDLKQAEDDLQKSRNECDELRRQCDDYKRILAEIEQALGYMQTRSDSETMQVWRWIQEAQSPVRALRSVPSMTFAPYLDPAITHPSHPHPHSHHDPQQQQHDPRQCYHPQERDQHTLLPPISSYHPQHSPRHSPNHHSSQPQHQHRLEWGYRRE